MNQIFVESLILTLLAAGSASLSNFFFRKNVDKTKNSVQQSNGYLLLYYLFSLLSCLIIYPISSLNEINNYSLLIGASVGVLNSYLMIYTFKALKTGPAGLTFAFQNSSALFPGLILFILFGQGYGFAFTFLQSMGLILVLTGLFLGTQFKSLKISGDFKWLKYILLCFFIQITALTFIQGRYVFLDLTQIVVPTQDDRWFILGQFGISFLFQLFLFLKEKRGLKLREMSYGSLGGVANFGSTFFLLLATKLALPDEQVILFPCFAVATMILCNLWANRFYNEKFNFQTNALCSLGILLAAS